MLLLVNTNQSNLPITWQQLDTFSPANKGKVMKKKKKNPQPLHGQGPTREKVAIEQQMCERKLCLVDGRGQRSGWAKPRWRP